MAINGEYHLNMLEDGTPLALTAQGHILLCWIAAEEISAMSPPNWRRQTSRASTQMNSPKQTHS
jgi:hypothetical protein